MSSYIKGDLAVERLQKEAYDEEFVLLAQKNGVDLPPLREGLSVTAINEIKQDENLNFWFYFDEDDGEAICSAGESGKAYDFEQDVDKMLKIVDADGCVANGTLVVEGSEQGDVYRLIITDNKATKEKATLRWPDGTEF